MQNDVTSSPVPRPAVGVGVGVRSRDGTRASRSMARD